MIDDKGNNLDAVAVPITGRGALAPYGATIPNSVEGAAIPLTLDPAFRSMGLRTTDGAPKWTWEKQGEDIEFFEDGYRLPSGLANVRVVVKLAELNPVVRELYSGKTADENGYLTVDGGGHATRYALYTEEAFRNGRVRRRIAPHATIASIVENLDERGVPMNWEVTFAIERHDAVNGEHFGEWVIGADEPVPPAPAAWAETTEYTLGEKVSLTGGEILEVTEAGTSGSDEPSAPGIGSTVVDGSVTWKQVAA